jgi:hypothetical protein
MRPFGRWTGTVEGALQRPSTPHAVMLPGHAVPSFDSQPFAAFEEKPEAAPYPRLVPSAAHHRAPGALRRRTGSRVRNGPWLRHHRARLTTRSLVSDYLALCRNPLKDLRRWNSEWKNNTRTRHPSTPPPQRSADAQSPPSRMAGPQYGIRADALHGLRGGLDEERRRWSETHRLSARSRASADQHDRLRPLRTEGGAAAPLRSDGETHHEEIAPAASLASEIAGVKSSYAARIAALSSTLSPAERTIVLRSIKNEKMQMIRAVIERWNAYFQNRKSKPEKNPERPSDRRPLLRLPGVRKD